MKKEKNIWWDKSIALVEGCSPVSVGCAHCWSAGMANRFRPELTTEGHFNGKIICREDRLAEILKRRKPTRWAIWNDLFHPQVPFEFIQKVFAVAIAADWHIFQFLTKQPQRALLFADWFLQRTGLRLNSFSHLWMGVSAENQEQADKRIPLLLQTPAAVRFVSVEPMLGAVEIEKYLRCQGCGYTELDKRIQGDHHLCTSPTNILDWVICGGESGPGARPMQLEWARDLRDQCKQSGVPFFMKQIDKKTAIPNDLMVREYPNE